MDEKEFERRLKEVCIKFDQTQTSYPEHEFEGAAVYEFYCTNIRDGNNETIFNGQWEGSDLDKVINWDTQE